MFARSAKTGPRVGPMQYNGGAMELPGFSKFLEDEKQVDVDFAWALTLARLLEETESVATVEEAVEALVGLGVDVVSLKAKIDRQRMMWVAQNKLRKLGLPDTFMDAALTAWIYTLPHPKIYEIMNSECHSEQRTHGMNGVNDRLKAVMTYAKHFDEMLQKLPAKYIIKDIVCFRGIGHAFEHNASHDPAGHFPAGRWVIWYDYKSSSLVESVAQGFIRRKYGARIIFKIHATCGYHLKDFSDIPNEEEVVFRLLTLLRVKSAQKNCVPAATTRSATDEPDIVELIQTDIANTKHLTANAQFTAKAIEYTLTKYNMATFRLLSKGYRLCRRPLWEGNSGI